MKANYKMDVKNMETVSVGQAESKKQPFVSVVMPMYNQEKYIVKCLESVLCQTLRDIEIIVVNDGSTDCSLSIVQKYAEADERILIIDKSNTGYGNSVNLGMRRATGQYIGIVETDDFIAPDMFETLYGLSEGGTVDVVKGNFYDYYEHIGRAPEPVENSERRDMPDVQEKFTIRQYPQILWGHPSVWSAIYRREFLIENHIVMKEVKGGGWVDNPFFFETLCKAESVKWTRRPLYYYRKTSANSSSTGVVDPNLPFDRMNDNLDVIEKSGYTDDVTLRYAYSRALMYANGALKESDYEHNYALIDAKAKNLLQRCDVEVFRKYFNLRDCYEYYEFTSPLKAINDTFPKILIYNWLPYDNPWHWGGGVTVYCKNLIDTIIKKYPFAQIYFLSSGFAYSAERLDTFIRKIPSAYKEHCRQYEIVNSPVPAAQDKLFVNPLVALQNEKLKETFKQFMQENGPFAAIHFNNIEGISLDVLDLKQDFPQTRFVYSMHNYVPICVTGFYYQRHNHCNCDPAHTAKDCILCTRKIILKDIADSVYKSAQFGVPPEKQCSKARWVKRFGFDRLDEDVKEDDILRFAQTATAKLNQNCDSILAVSKRVYDIAAENGLDKNKLAVSYIGTEVAKRQVGKSLYKPKNGLKVVFLGNSISYEEKGYPFFLDTLEQLSGKYASQIDLVLTVRDAQHAEIYQMLKKFRSVKVIQGYTHADLVNIFEGCNLSIVPVLWEDNLPQIAIESAAYGVPVLASSCGGASELTDNELFRFEGGNAKDMLAKLIHFVEHPEDLDTYWNGYHGLMTMERHLQELLPHYGLPVQPEPLQVTMQDYSFLLMENEFLREHVVIDGNAADDRALRRELEEARERIKALEANERTVAKLNKLLPPGSLRRKIVKRFFGRVK